MQVILLMVAVFLGYIIAYNTYGKYLSKKIFNLSDHDDVPSRQFEDGVDYVPTKKWVIFGHHFTSITGTSPIVGPAIAVIWGWLPAVLWVLFGSIFIGAMHDFGALVLSLKNQGKSISEIAAKYVGTRVRVIFFLIIFFELLIVIAIFGLVIAVVFKMYPQSVFAVWMEIPIAIFLGYVVYKKNGNIKLFTTIAVFLMYVTVFMGHFEAFQFSLPQIGSIPATGSWTIILLVYAFIASTLPVTTLLQPRDYINSWQLFIAMGFLVIGIIAAGFTTELKIVAPVFNPKPEGAPQFIPFLFITIACGAISGFHSLVSSGTSSKQISRTSDARFIGYGSMLLEATLATLVIIATVAGIGLAYKTKDGSVLKGLSAWQAHYSSWGSVTVNLGAKLRAFIIGSANMIEVLGIPKDIGKIIIGVFIASFAGTTLDTATRIQRYVVTELFSHTGLKKISNKYVTTAFVVITAAALAFATGASGAGAMKLWPMFGAVNQMLAALALLVLTIYLKKKGGKKFLISALPCLFMIVMTIWGLIINEQNFLRSDNGLLIVLNAAIFILAVWMIIESCIQFFKVRADT